jgi:hypothetical protein
MNKSLSQKDLDFEVGEENAMLANLSRRQSPAPFPHFHESK